MDNIFNSLQLLGGIILSIGYIPQIRQIIKTKSVNDINFKYILLITIGVLLMETYAIYNLLNGVAVFFFITNTISLASSLTMLVLYLLYNDKVDHEFIILNPNDWLKTNRIKVINFIVTAINDSMKDLNRVNRIFLANSNMYVIKISRNELINEYKQLLYSRFLPNTETLKMLVMSTNKLIDIKPYYCNKEYLIFETQEEIEYDSMILTEILDRELGCYILCLMKESEFGIIDMGGGNYV